MKKILLMLAIVASSFTAQSQAFLTHTIDSILAYHDGIEGQYRFVVDSSTNDSVLLIQTRWYILSAHIGQKTHQCYGYHLAITDSTVSALYDTALTKSYSYVGNNKWVTTSGKIYVVKHGIGRITVNQLWAEGMIYEVGFTFDAFIPNKKKPIKRPGR